MGKILNFTFEEFFNSDIAKAKGINNTTSNPKHLNNWMNLVHFVLQPIRNKVVSSKLGTCLKVVGAYRSPKLVLALGSAKTGHPDGECADLVVPGITQEKLFNFIIDMYKNKEIEYDQLIWEKDSNCVHIGYRGTQNRKQTMIRTKVGGKYHYENVLIK